MDKKFKSIQVTTEYPVIKKKSFFSQPIEDALDLLEYNLGRGFKTKEIFERLKAGERVVVNQPNGQTEIYEFSEEEAETTVEFAERVLNEISDDPNYDLIFNKDT